MVLFPADTYERVLFVQLFLLRGRMHFSDQLGEMKKAEQSFTSSLCCTTDAVGQLPVEIQALHFAQELVCGEEKV